MPWLPASPFLPQHDSAPSLLATITINHVRWSIGRPRMLQGLLFPRIADVKYNGPDVGIPWKQGYDLQCRMVGDHNDIFVTRGDKDIERAMSSLDCDAIDGRFYES